MSRSVCLPGKKYIASSSLATKHLNAKSSVCKFSQVDDFVCMNKFYLDNRQLEIDEKTGGVFARGPAKRKTATVGQKVVSNGHGSNVDAKQKSPKRGANGAGIYKKPASAKKRSPTPEYVEPRSSDRWEEFDEEAEEYLSEESENYY